MSKYKICSRDDCPRENVKMDETTNCGKCNATIHLKCIGINVKISELFHHENMRLFCNVCHTPNKTTTTKSTTTTPSVTTPTSSLKISSRQRQITDFTSNSNVIEIKLNEVISILNEAKIGNIVPMLNDMKSNVSDVTKVVKNQSEATKSYASVLTEIKETTNEIKMNKTARPLLPTNVSGKKTPNLNLNTDFPSLGLKTPKRRRFDDNIETPKHAGTPKQQQQQQRKIFKDRKLECGTNESNDNNLGSPVKFTRPKRISPYAHLSKSIYVSRLKNDVTIDKITGFISGKIPGVKLEDFALNMLVKKDQALDQLSFISFRLRCTPEYYVKFKDASFWPKHVMIGDFIEQPRKQTQVSDFSDETTTNTDENKSSDVIVIVDDPSKNDNENKEQTTQNAEPQIP